VDSRDAMLAADMLRFDGANQNELWDTFASRGLGKSAESPAIDEDENGDRTDLDASPGYDSPLRSDEAVVTFTAPEGVTDMEVFTGVYEARATPTADTVADTPAGDKASFVPGEYQFIARADGFGAQRFTATLAAGEIRTLEVPFRRNLASLASGATITGDGVNLEKLIDDTEETNWASLESEGTASEGKQEGAQVEGRQVTVDLAGDEAVDVREIQVSAALRGRLNETEEGDSPPDNGSQNRFSALRSFDVFTCDASTGADCGQAESFTQVFSSADDAFPGKRPRPKVPDFIVRPFDVTDSKATHLRLVVRDNQCTGGPDFQGETNPDDDPNFTPDCDTEDADTIDRAVLSPPFDQVRAAELQVFETASTPPAGGKLKGKGRGDLQRAPAGPGAAGQPR
jgi:extracellular elastinolytic metalloproteinase